MGWYLRKEMEIELQRQVLINFFGIKMIKKWLDFCIMHSYANTYNSRYQHT